VISENGIAPHIRYRHTIQSADWSSEARCWRIAATRLRADGGSESVEIAANFLWMCQGYYRHSEGYTPEWRGMDRFQGRVVHPQSWPDDLDLEGRR
jgi:cation diffusion facilitator CzcD-associated flavoprotein CzcO